MKTFDTFEEVVGMMHCMKRPIVVHAKQIDEEKQMGKGTRIKVSYASIPSVPPIESSVQ